MNKDRQFYRDSKPADESANEPANEFADEFADEPTNEPTNEPVGPTVQENVAEYRIQSQISGLLMRRQLNERNEKAKSMHLAIGIVSGLGFMNTADSVVPLSERFQ